MNSPISQISKVYSENLQKLILKLLEKDPIERPYIYEIFNYDFVKEQIKYLKFDTKNNDFCFNSSSSVLSRESYNKLSIFNSNLKITKEKNIFDINNSNIQFDFSNNLSKVENLTNTNSFFEKKDRRNNQNSSSICIENTNNKDNSNFYNNKNKNITNNRNITNDSNIGELNKVLRENSKSKNNYNIKNESNQTIRELNMINMDKKSSNLKISNNFQENQNLEIKINYNNFFKSEKFNTKIFQKDKNHMHKIFSPSMGCNEMYKILNNVNQNNENVINLKDKKLSNNKIKNNKNKIIMKKPYNKKNLCFSFKDKINEEKNIIHNKNSSKKILNLNLYQLNTIEDLDINNKPNGNNSLNNLKNNSIYNNNLILNNKINKNQNFSNPSHVQPVLEYNINNSNNINQIEIYNKENNLVIKNQIKYRNSNFDYKINYINTGKNSNNNYININDLNSPNNFTSNNQTKKTYKSIHKNNLSSNTKINLKNNPIDINENNIENNPTNYILSNKNRLHNRTSSQYFLNFSENQNSNNDYLNNINSIGNKNLYSEENQFLEKFILNKDSSPSTNLEDKNSIFINILKKENTKSSKNLSNCKIKIFFYFSKINFLKQIMILIQAKHKLD